MRRWLQRFARRDLLLLLWGFGFILLMSALLHILEPRRIVKWDDMLAQSASH
ncbi:MAG: hypothetical protein ACK4MV_11630 [Beijerinckiaceae bacterium]